MQIIQSIREKGAAIIIIVIAISLIGFILMDSRPGSAGSLFGGGPGDNLGKVNGEKITIADFNKKVQDAANMEAQRAGQQPGGSRMDQIRDQVWNQMVAERVFFKETKKLGIQLTSTEVKAILLSNDPVNPFLQERGMMNEAGQLDMEKAQQAYNNIKKSKGDQRAMVEVQILDPIKINSAVAKYSGLLNASAYYPSWMKERDNKEASAFATISYVAVPYNEISDSTVAVSDADINEYVGKHKSLFKQEPGRTISYVTYSGLPSNADSAATKKLVEELKASFAADTNAKAFVARNTSAIDFTDDFVPRSKITSPFADTIIKQPAGVVYGPYADGKNYVLSKVIGSKMLPDSVNARHILIGTVDPQSGKQLMEDSAAHKLADSVLALVKGGADFNALVAKYSTDEGSKAKGGLYEHVSYGQMVPEFNNFIFTKPVGEKGVVKTQFGYHVIDVLSQKDMKPAYKIAYIAKEIGASSETVNEASLAATKASAQKDRAALEAYLKPLGKALVENPAIIKENDFSLGNMQDARGLIKWVFGAKKGEISEPFSIGDNFVVATVDKIYEEGTQDAATARSGAEAVIRNQKKADIIVKKLGATPTLASAAAAYNKAIAAAGADSSITMAAQIINGLGVEYKVIGAAFNKDNQAKASAPIPGTTAVYVIQTTAVANKAEVAPEMLTQRAAAALTKIRNQAANWFEALKTQSAIKDNRSKFF